MKRSTCLNSFWKPERKKFGGRKDITYDTKSWLYYALIIAIIYTCNTWKPKKEDIQQRLTSFKNSCLKVMTGKNIRNRNKMATIRKKKDAKT